MTFKAAAQFRMPFGQYAHQTLDEIAKTDKGLRYLDWLCGERDGKDSPFDTALATYLDDPAIKKELENCRYGR